MENIDKNSYNQGLYTALNLLAIVGNTPQVCQAKELIREQILN